MSMIVNRRDLDFLLYEFMDIEALFETPRYNAYDRESLSAIFDTAQAIAEEKYLSCASKLDANEPTFKEGKVSLIPEVKEALDAYRESGFFAASFDEELGGFNFLIARVSL